MKQNNEIKWAIILLFINVFLTLKSISATYRAAKYSLEGQKYAIDIFVQVTNYSVIFFFLAIITLMFGFFYDNKRITKYSDTITLLLVALGLIVLLIPYFWTGF